MNNSPEEAEKALSGRVLFCSNPDGATIFVVPSSCVMIQPRVTGGFSTGLIISSFKVVFLISSVTVAFKSTFHIFKLLCFTGTNSFRYKNHINVYASIFSMEFPL